MHDISYYNNTLKFIYSSYQSLSPQIWSENLCLLLNEFVLTYHLEKNVNVNSIKELPCKEQYEFVKSLINSHNSDFYTLPNWEYDNTSLIMKANQMLSSQSPVEFSFITMCNSDGYEVGRFGYTENRDSYVIAISEIHYKGLWKDLEKEMTKKINQCSFDVKFISNNEEFIIQGKDIGLQLNWPWMYAKDNEIVDHNVLIEVIIKKNKHKNMDSAFNYWLRIIASFC